MTDLEQRAQRLLDGIQRRKQAELADKVFREPGRRAAQKEMREREEAEQLKQLENRWNPWLEKAMQHEEQEKKKYDDELNALKR